MSDTQQGAQQAETNSAHTKAGVMYANSKMYEQRYQATITHRIVVDSALKAI